MVICFIFLIGIILKIFILQPLLHFIEKLFKKIPLIRTIYTGIKQLINALAAKDQSNFKRVVLIEFPRPEIFSLGFLTSQVPQETSPNKAITYFNVYIPHTPNPTTGYFVMVPKEQIIEVALTQQEAMSLIISGGILQPERYTKGNSTKQ